jgi:hypothetical protein
MKTKLKALLPLVPGWLAVLYIVGVAGSFPVQEDFLPASYRPSPWPDIFRCIILTALLFKWNPPLKPSDVS